MKLKKYSLVILSIILILLVFASSASAADTNGTDIISIDESTNNEKLALDYSPDTSGESNDTNIIENNENNLLSADNDESGNVLRDGTGTFADLQTEISTALSSGNYVKLTKDTYTYAGSGSQIEIGKSCTIDGNGAVIDMAGSNIRVFYITASDVTIKNLTIKNANFNGNGGAIYFSSSGTVENCNFTNNTASNSGGAICFGSPGTTHEVRNCNFTANQASRKGGAIYFGSSGSVENCNFTNNSANFGGAIYFEYGSTHEVRNCNFTNNTASDRGGAVYFVGNGTVTNCNFTGNNATTGSAIYFYKYYSTDTLTISNSTFLNNRANAEALEVTKNENNITITFTGNDNLLNAICSRNDAEVTFTNVTYWSAKGIANTGSSTPGRSNKEAGQNITVSVIVNDVIVLSEVYLTNENGTIVLPTIAGDNYFIGARHDTDSYYTEKVNTTSNNTKFNVNVTSQTTNNKTVNITAKSNIPNEIIKGKLLFILPNGDEINATYATNGTWWALHIFDDVGDYNISASYIGLDNVTINNATISIRYEARVDVNNKTLNLEIGQNFTIVATTTPEGLDVTYVQDDSGVYIVDKNGVVTALKNGTGSVLVQIGGDGIYAKNSTIVNVTVSKVPTEISVLNDTLDLKVDGVVETGATLTPADAGNLTYTVSNSSVKVENGKIIALAEGSATITVSFAGDDKYAAAENKTIEVTVSPKPKENLTLEATVSPITIGEEAVIVVTGFKNATGTVSLVMLRIYYFGEIEDGLAKFTTQPLFGNTDAIISYHGDDNYNPVDIAIVIIIDYALSIDAPCEVTEGENATVTVTLPEDATGTVTIGNEAVPVVNGTASAVLTNLPVGTTNVSVTYSGDDKYNPIEDSVNVTVKPEFIIDAPDVVKYYHGPERFVVTITDGDGNPLADKSVDIIVNGVKYPRTTDANGCASIGLNLNSGNYTVSAVYNNTTVNATVTILSTVEGNDLVKVFRNATPYTAVFRDSEGNYLAKGTLVEYNINGVMYRKEVGENGVAKLNINLPQGTYIITAINTVTGENCANNITVLSRIVDNHDITKFYKNDTQYTVKLIGDDGNPVGAGEVVTFNINGVFYNRTTDENGVAQLNINLSPGDYIVTAEYKGCKVSNNIKVLPVLSAKDITKKQGGPEQFIATLLDGQGKPYEGQNVTFNINGVFYNKPTDSNGQAKLNINLQAGEYIITSSYNGTNVANKVTVIA